MERLTQEEWTAVRIACMGTIQRLWQNAAKAYENGSDAWGDALAAELVTLESAYSKLVEWPYEPVN